MEKLIFVEKDDTRNINNYLEEGWTIKEITPISARVSLTGSTYNCVTAPWGAYVVIQK